MTTKPPQTTGAPVPFPMTSVPVKVTHEATPVGYNVLFRQPAKKTTGGIVLPDEVDNGSPFACVVKVGPLVTLVKEGDLAVLARYDAPFVPGTDKQFILNENHVIGTVKEL